MVLEEPDSEVRDTLDVLNLEATNCAQIIENLLDVARPRSLVLHEVHINQVVQDPLSHATVSDNIGVVRRLDQALRPVVVDPGQLAQVLGNIITNAFQAMPVEGD